MRLRIDWRSKYDFVGNFNEGFAPVELDDKHGFVNAKGEEIVPLKYDNVRDFHDGLAQVNLNHHWGFINTKGEEVVPLKYDDAWLFFNGYVKVKLKRKWGVVNEKGEEVVPLKFTEEETLEIPRGADLLSFKMGISKEEALKLIIEEMKKRK